MSGFKSALETGGADSQATSGALISSHSSQRHHMPGNREDENASSIEPGGQGISWIGGDPTIFNVFNQFGDDFVDMTLPVDISALDSILFSQHISDLPVAERLEFMAHFTSTQGMRTFTDQESFRRQQKMACEAYEKQLALQHSDEEKKAKRKVSHHDLSKVKIEHNEQDMGDIDPLQIRSCELIDKLADAIRNKTSNDFITIEWTSGIEQMCRGFFLPSNIHRFLEYFWSLWYPHCPIVHKPLFDASSASAELLCVMILIGACFSPNENDNEISRKWLDSVEELIFRQVYFRSDRELLLDEPVQRKGIVQCIQAAYLVCSLQKREGSVEAQARIRRHRHASMVTVSTASILCRNGPEF